MQSARQDPDQRAGIIRMLTAPDGPYAVETLDVRGIPYRVYANAPNDVRTFLAAAAGHGDGIALAYEDETCSWPEFLDRITRVAKVLHEDLGVRPGDRVALAMRNLPEWPIVFGAIVSLGAIAVPLNAWLVAGELAAALNDCAARVVVCDAERASRIQQVRDDLPGLRMVVEVRAPGEVTGDETLEAMLDTQPVGVDLSGAAIDPDSDCTIIYTSGTTGRPKGAVATHRAHVAGIMNTLFTREVERRLISLTGPAPAGCTLVTSPLFHIAGLPMSFLNPYLGITTVLLRKWDAVRAVELIEKYRVTSTSGVPTVVEQLLDALEHSPRDTSSLRLVGTGGAQVSSSLVRRITTASGGRLATGTAYGLTETTGPMVRIGSADLAGNPQAVGLPYPTSEIRIVGENGDEVAPGEAGEAWFRGPNVARGYWNRESGAFTGDGWFRSGDLVVRDEAGFLSIVDRIKDVIIRAGENVYCSEVEDVLLAAPGVVEVSVYGMPHETWGEEVTATVRGESAPAELRSYAAARLAAFKVPTRWAFTADPLPRNAAGKVLKRELQAGHRKSGG
ncbi:class I adenylate-forming enzyme family protein [Amycolatopsis jejuensis]|uniref:class I adenylate-forming enzyme family protein n=1 Tax=Amycolatopsis jejuensis TaxID=330084 RepID=UPI000526EE8A|nr:class I adenylate-forming enzyme family protein [Amycolatopsis jejuensis]